MADKDGKDGDDHSPSSLNEQESAFSYDEVLEHIGELGAYQLRTFFALLMPCFFFGLMIMCYTFTAGIPQYRSISSFIFI